MPETFRCISAIIRTDILFRFRRTAALVTLLIIAAGVYLVVPDVDTGRTLIQIDGRRVLYNSAAVALGTGMFCTLFLSLLGYYLISNSFRRDILSRAAFVIAASPVTDTQYVVGKFLGNIVYLAAIMLACMMSSMVMFLIRGEGAIEPLVFLSIYVWLVMPSIVFCSSTALAFEALPLLSGRLGDVLYFFLWAFVLGFPAAIIENNVGPGWLSALDIVGIIPIITQLRQQFHTTAMSIGSSTFDASREPILFTGIEWSFGIIAQRLSTFILPAVLLMIARTWFHRFDPTRIKSSVRHGRRNVLGRLNVALKPVSGFVQMLARAGSGGRSETAIISAVRADVFATLLLSPLTTMAIVVFAVLSLVMEATEIREGLLPAIVVALVIALADIATRDHSSRMMNLLFTAPKLRAHYVMWKFASALVVTFCFTLIPIVRLVIEIPSAAASLLVGSCFTASAAVGLGVIARSQKAFIAVFLMLLYIALNAADVPAFDFAGFHARATTGVQLGYAALTALLLLVAYARHKKLLGKA